MTKWTIQRPSSKKPSGPLYCETWVSNVKLSNTNRWDFGFALHPPTGPHSQYLFFISWVFTRTSESGTFESHWNIFFFSKWKVKRLHSLHLHPSSEASRTIQLKPVCTFTLQEMRVCVCGSGTPRPFSSEWRGQCANYDCEWNNNNNESISWKQTKMSSNIIFF